MTLLKVQPKHCLKCNKALSKRNKSGLCQPCSKIKVYNSGYTINNIEFVEELGQDQRGYALWKFRCHCGRYFINTSSKVALGRAKSCGCSHHVHCRKLGE